MEDEERLVHPKMKLLSFPQPDVVSFDAFLRYTQGEISNNTLGVYSVYVKVSYTAAEKKQRDHSKLSFNHNFYIVSISDQCQLNFNKSNL